MRRIPTAPLVLGLSGLIPFLWGALTHVVGPLADWSAAALGARFTGQMILQGYGIVILAFMSGVIWGFATRASGRFAVAAYVASVLPALWAFFMGTGPAGPALQALAIGFAALIALDVVFWRMRLTPPWWLSLRLVLTAIVVACVSVGAYA